MGEKSVNTFLSSTIVSSFDEFFLLQPPNTTGTIHGISKQTPTTKQTMRRRRRRRRRRGGGDLGFGFKTPNFCCTN
jgi:hypothetical protein